MHQRLTHIYTHAGLCILNIPFSHQLGLNSYLSTLMSEFRFLYESRFVLYLQHH